MTRPQGNIFANGKCYEAGRGKIGYTILHSLNELTPEAILEATIFNDQFILEEWGGCNQLFMLDDGNVGILSHIARFDEAGNRHYYSSAFCMNPQTGEHTPMKLIAVRDNFALGAAKRKDLTDVIFSGGLERNKNKKAMLYCGVNEYLSFDLVPLQTASSFAKNFLDKSSFCSLTFLDFQHHQILPHHQQ